MREEIARPLHPNRDPLFLYALLRLGPERFFWYVRYHHLCMDGFGGALIAKRVAQIYSSLARNDSSVPPSTFQSSFNLSMKKKNIVALGAAVIAHTGWQP